MSLQFHENLQNSLRLVRRSKAIPSALLRVAKCLCIVVLLMMKFAPPAEELNLLGRSS